MYCSGEFFFMAFYLKYRPQTLEEVLGQESVKKTLLSAYSSEKLSHAYLFVGPRGTGKTSTARILAKMVNCSAKQQVPCNKCDSCVSITDGSNMDLIEIDAASNNGVEDIRSLRDKVKLAPTTAGKKVYIIDEVHMLSTSAFNALLKTLEEPPIHALFILATTEAQKIPATILSRVQRLDFKLASLEDIEKGLRRIVEVEKIEIEDTALQALAQKADGSFRDSVKLLDQLASLGKKVTLDDVIEAVHSTKFETVIIMLESMSKKDSKQTLIQISKLVEQGINTKELTLSLIESLRFLMLIKNDLGIQLVQDELGSDKHQELVTLAEKFTMEDLVKTLDALLLSLEKLKFSSIQSLPLELAIVQICNLREKVTTQAKVVEVESGSIVVAEFPSSPKLSDDVSDPDVAKLLEKWNFVLETVRPYNFALEALLRSVKILSCEGNIVAIEVPYSFHQRQLEVPKSKDLLESVLSEILEKSVRISVSLGVRPVRVEDIANVEIAADDEIIRMASEIFNGKLVD